MRVIAGLVKGRKLKSLEGLDTRPTTDRIKESIFNIIQFDIEGRRVLDLFAGTGQLGIEALSRGARQAVFIDQKRSSVKVIEDNIKTTGFEANSQVLQSDAFAYISKRPETFDLIFLDPPYNANMLNKALKMIAEFDILSESGIIITECSENHVLPELNPPYSHIRDYEYGKTKISLFSKTVDF